MVAIARRKCVGDDEAPASISRTAARSSDHRGSDLGKSAAGKKKKTVLRTFSQTTTFVCLGGTMSACQIFGFRVCGAQPRHGRVASARHTSTRASTSRRRTPPNAAKLALRTPPASAARARDRHPRSHTLTTPTRPSDIGNASSFRELHVEPRLDELTRADACRRSRARRAPRARSLGTYLSLAPSFPLRRARARAHPPERSGTSPGTVGHQSYDAYKVYKWQARKRFLPNFQPSFFFFPVCEQALIAPSSPLPAPPRSQAERASGFARSGAMRPRALWHPQPRAARSSRTSPSPPFRRRARPRRATT